MKVFNPADFVIDEQGRKRTEFDCGFIANTANKLLAERGTKVYGIDLKEGGSSYYTNKDRHPPTHTALLINIEPIEVCKHPSEKVMCRFYTEKELETLGHFCECGAHVTPTISYKEVT